MSQELPAEQLKNGAFALSVFGSSNIGLGGLRWSPPPAMANSPSTVNDAAAVLLSRPSS
jgi:hypothetical protein